MRITFFLANEKISQRAGHQQIKKGTKRLEKWSSFRICCQADGKSRWINKSAQVELHHSWTKRFTMGRRPILIDNGLFKWFPSKTTKMYVQASTSAPKHLSIRDSMFVDIERRVRLETQHYSEANPIRNPEAFEGWAEHRQPRPTVTLKHVQERPP